MSNLDNFIWYCQQLKGPNYRYEGGRDGTSYEYCQQYGVDCSGMFDVVLRYMGLKDETPMGTVAISNMLVDWEAYDPDKFYLKGTVIVNDNATGWVTGDDSHVAMIIEDEAMYPGYAGQRIIHSWNPQGVDDSGTDVNSHQYSWYEWAGFLPHLVPETTDGQENSNGQQPSYEYPLGWFERDAEGYLKHVNGPSGWVHINEETREMTFQRFMD